MLSLGYLNHWDTIFLTSTLIHVDLPLETWICCPLIYCRTRINIPVLDRRQATHMNQLRSPCFTVDFADLIDHDPCSLFITLSATLPLLVLIHRLTEQLITAVSNTVSSRTAAGSSAASGVQAVAPDVHPQEGRRHVRVQDFG